MQTPNYENKARTLPDDYWENQRAYKSAVIRGEVRLLKLIDDSWQLIRVNHAGEAEIDKEGEKCQE